jgi:hypothetical protein
MQRSTEVSKRGENAFGVGRIGSNPHVEVLRRANEAMAAKA